MRTVGYIALFVLPLLLAAREPPPEIGTPVELERNFIIRGASLAISPGVASTYLEFAGAVTCIAENMVLTTDVLEINVRSSEITGGQQLKLPKMPEVDEYEVENPGETVKEMAKELEVPSARFSTSAIERVGAAGNVKIEADGMALSTEQLVSTDGGRSWSASGRSTLRMVEPETGDAYEMSADYLLYDRETRRALARGSIRGQFQRPETPVIHFEAERLELDMVESLVSVSDYLLVTYESYSLCCGSLEADIANNNIQASDTPQIGNLDASISASMGQISFDLETQVIKATGGVAITDTRQQITLQADQITVDLLADMVIATGNPLLQHGESEFHGERIVMRKEEGKTIIEVEGPQKARLDLENLPEGLSEAIESPPDEAPEGQDFADENSGG